MSLPFALLGLVVLMGCGQVTTDVDAAGGSVDAPSGTDGNSSVDAADNDGTPAIDAPLGIDAPGPFCGDGMVNGNEVCDSGANNGSYGYCNAQCTGLGPRCGDGVQNGPEACDSAGNNGMYGYCNSTCTALGPRCGDSITNGPEACDSGANNGSYGYCNGTCSALGPRCGDSITNGPEACDQGTVYSSTMQANVCRPDCAGTVQNKFIGVSPARVTPAQGGIGAIDSLCVAAFGAGYKGLVTDGVNRIATVSPNAGDGQVGWVVAPYTRYVSIHSNLLVFVSDNTRMIGASGGQDRNLENPIGTAAQDDNYGVWVGAESDWRSSHDCQNWTSSDPMYYGVGPATQATGAGVFPNNNGVSLCSNTRRFFCIQQ